jgi:hypothetical protein
MFHVREIGRPFGILAGPFKAEAEAVAADGAIEIEQPQYRALTEVCSYSESEPVAAAVTLPGIPMMPAAVH